MHVILACKRLQSKASLWIFVQNLAALDRASAEEFEASTRAPLSEAYLKSGTIIRNAANSRSHSLHRPGGTLPPVSVIAGLLLFAVCIPYRFLRQRAERRRRL